MDRVARRALAVPALLAALLTAAGCSPARGAHPPTGATSPSGAAPSATAPSGTTPNATTPSGTTPTTTASPSTNPTRAGASALDWPTYHRTLDRAGTVTGLPAVRRLGPGWTAALDGAVYGQPIVVSGLAIAATESDTVYGLDLATGDIRWTTHLGTPVPGRGLSCGDIDPLGITGTPAYDATTGSVFLVAETTGGRHDLVALDARTAEPVRVPRARRWSRPGPHARGSQRRHRGRCAMTGVVRRAGDVPWCGAGRSPARGTDRGRAG